MAPTRRTAEANVAAEGASARRSASYDRASFLSADRLPRWLKTMLAGIARARTLGLAAEMSFWLFLSLVPLAAVAGLVAARLAKEHGQWLTVSLASSMPLPARDLLARQVGRVAAWGNGVAPLALGTFLWLAASGVHAVFDAMEVQSGTSRPWWKKRLLSIATCVALSVGVALLALLGAGLEWIQRLAGTSLPAPIVSATHGLVGQALRWLIAGAVAMAMIAGLYRVGIGRSSKMRMSVFPGAALAVALMAVLGWGYGFYVAHIGGGDAYQAGLTVVGVTLMTLWLFSIALLLGVQLNRVVGETRAGQGAPSRSVGRGRVDVPRDLRAEADGEAEPVAPNSHASL